VPQPTPEQPTRSAWGVAIRFLAGMAAAVPAGWLLLPGEFFIDTGHLTLCLVVSTLVAGILSLVRGGYPRGALALVGAFGLLQLGQTWSQGPRAAVVMVTWSVVVGAGVFLAAMIFDRLAELGYTVGKFLLLGPLVGAVYLASTPLAELSNVLDLDVVTTMWLFTYLGIVIGDGAGFGVEVVDLLDARNRTRGEEANAAPGGRPETDRQATGDRERTAGAEVERSS
jgi:hypothetical protein